MFGLFVTEGSHYIVLVRKIIVRSSIEPQPFSNESDTLPLDDSTSHIGICLINTRVLLRVRVSCFVNSLNRECTIWNLSKSSGICGISKTIHSCCHDD